MEAVRTPDPPAEPVGAPVVVVMGVSGSGKTTVGGPLAARLGVEYGEADRFHPQSNIDKMASGRPLDDAARGPWLEAIGRWLAEHSESAVFLHLQAPKNVLEPRMDHRPGHFMPPRLLDSQLRTLEPLQPDERGLVVDSNTPVDDIVDELVTWWANLQRSSWASSRSSSTSSSEKEWEMAERTDMVSVLVKDHQEMKEFFRQLEATTDAKERRDIADRLTAEVARHSVAEEMFLYPAARKVLPNGDALVEEELQEHSEAEELLKQWEGMSGDDPDFMTVFGKIKEGLLHHIDEEEESKLFPQMREALSVEEQEQLGQKITVAKKLAPTRPHPSAPDEPPMNIVVGVPTGIVDRVRDLMSGRSTD